MEETIAKQKFQNQKYSTRWNQNKKMKINERKEKKILTSFGGQTRLWCIGLSVEIMNTQYSNFTFPTFS
jgi:hypothetical protein